MVRFNAAHTEPVSQRDFVELLAEIAGLQPKLVPVPRATIEAAGGQLSGGNMYFGEVLDLPPHTQVIDKARRILGFEPTPLADALRTGFAWYEGQPRRPVDYSFEDRVLAMA